MMYPIFVDGPLIGKEIPIKDDATGYYYRDFVGEDKLYLYRFTQIGWHYNGISVIILVAAVDIASVDGEVLLGMILSDRAKEARSNPPAVDSEREVLWLATTSDRPDLG